MDLKALSEERDQLLEDLLTGKVPKRVAINVNFPAEFAIQYAGKDLIDVQWNTNQFEQVIEKVCQDFVTDTLPVRVLRFPLVYKTLGARNFVMGSNSKIRLFHCAVYNHILRGSF